MKLIYHGTRGSLSVPSSDKLKVGCNTLCVELQPEPNKVIILDAGFGIINLGNRLAEGMDLSKTNEFHIFLSHFHWDHIQGLQYFRPIYYPTTKIYIYSPIAKKQTQKAIEDIFTGCYSPFESLYNLPSTLEFKKITKKGIKVQGVNVTHFLLDHTSPTFAYRLTDDKYSVVYATDHEAADVKINKPFINFCKGADILVHDAMYTEKEYDNRVGFGHSTIESAIDNGIKAEVGQLHLFHHGIGRKDQDLFDYVDEVLSTKSIPSSIQVHIAKENDHYDLSKNP